MSIEITPEMLAAAWRKVRSECNPVWWGPGPGFKEALQAAFDAASDPWMPIETAPKDGTTILIFFKNEIGKSRIIKAVYIPRFHEESIEDWSEYSEERDRYYTPEGWYEQHEFGDEYSAYHIDGVILTHWMPLPKPPKQQDLTP